MRNFWKVWVGVLAAVVLTGAAQAVPYIAPNGETYELEYWAGSGANEAVVVVDFGQAAADVFAFGYRWDGVATGQNALEAIDTAGDLDIVAGLGFFVETITYDVHTGTYGPPPDYLPWWSYWNDDAVNPGDPIEWVWDINAWAVTRELMAGSFDAWFLTNQDWMNMETPPRQPPLAQTGDGAIPEPGTVALLALGLGALASRRRRQARLA